jgi:hypothetical protein
MTTPDALTRVRVALDALVDGLQSGRADDVLAAEPAIAAAARALATSEVATLPGAETLRRDLSHIRALIARCRSLGGVATELEGIMFPSPYGATGARLRGRALPPTMASRT